MKKPNLEDYLKKNHNNGIIDHVLRATLTEDGMQFYIHPASKSGNTLDYKVRGNKLTQLHVQEDPLIESGKLPDGPVPYEVNKEFLHVYQAIGESHGLIPIYNAEGKAKNLYVGEGDLIFYKDDEICVVSRSEYLAGLQEPTRYYKLR